VFEEAETMTEILSLVFLMLAFFFLRTLCMCVCAFIAGSHTFIWSPLDIRLFFSFSLFENTKENKNEIY